MKASSSIGRAPLSKSGGCGFDSCLACLKPIGEAGARRSLKARVRLSDWPVLTDVAPPDRPGGVRSEEYSVAKATAVRQPNAVVRYVRETIGELRKVNWPTRAQALNLTMIVIVVSTVMAIFLGIADALFTRLFALIFA